MSSVTTSMLNDERLALDYIKKILNKTEDKIKFNSTLRIQSNLSREFYKKQIESMVEK